MNLILLMIKPIVDMVVLFIMNKIAIREGNKNMIDQYYDCSKRRRKEPSNAYHFSSILVIDIIICILKVKKEGMYFD